MDERNTTIRSRNELRLPTSICIRFISVLLICWSMFANAEAIHGRVIDPRGASVPQSHLTLLNSGGRAIAEKTSGLDGGFTLPGIDPGVYQLKAEAPSFLTVVVDVSVAAGQQIEISVQ